MFMSWRGSKVSRVPTCPTFLLALTNSPHLGNDEPKLTLLETKKAFVRRQIDQLGVLKDVNSLVVLSGASWLVVVSISSWTSLTRS